MRKRHYAYGAIWRSTCETARICERTPEEATDESPSHARSAHAELYDDANLQFDGADLYLDYIHFHDIGGSGC